MLLQFDNDLVRSQLIINQTIEKVALVQDRRRAHDVLDSSPVNVRSILCFQDKSRTEGYIMAAGQQGNKRMDPIMTPKNKQGQMARIATDNQSQIK